MFIFADLYLLNSLFIVGYHYEHIASVKLSEHFMIASPSTNKSNSSAGAVQVEANLLKQLS